MDLKEFREYVIENARKYIFEGDELDETKQKILKQPELPKLTKPSFTKKDINKVPKVPKVPKEPDAPEAKAIKPPEKKAINESISPEKIKLLAEEMKKINKKIDLRNPLISPELFNIISEEKNIENTIEKEDQSKRWKNLYNYEVPKDDLR
jgi:hypothetical protein